MRVSWGEREREKERSSREVGGGGGGKNRIRKFRCPSGREKKGRAKLRWGQHRKHRVVEQRAGEWRRIDRYGMIQRENDGDG